MKRTYTPAWVVTGIWILLLVVPSAPCQTRKQKTESPGRVSFSSNTLVRVFNSSNVFIGLARHVCLNAAYPMNCPSDATLYGYPGAGWVADLSNIPDATWIYAPGVTGSTSPAQLLKFYFESTFNIPGTPTGGQLYISVDDAAEITVNDEKVALLGSLINLVESQKAQSALHAFNIGGFLVKGENHIRIRQNNGPAWFGNCSVPDNFTCNPSGLVFGGYATYMP
ncbi:MAG TPA: hypothetical protein VJQ82_18150 [Terriglobales bacterium]|nr:hypothetical protein [Terriglobales bacterium]